MSDEIVARLDKIPGATTLGKYRDGFWMDAPQIDVEAMARVLNELGARFSTASGIALDDGETVIVYHWVCGHDAINIRTQTQHNQMPSIATMIRAANWIEREIHDLYSVDFIGHPNLVRLIRPPQLAEGLYRETRPRGTA